MVRLSLLPAGLAAAAALAQPAPSTRPAPWSRPLAEIALHPQREASAQAVSLNESRIAAEIAGRILDLPAQAGQVVPSGAVIARLDCRDHELALERALASNAAVRARLELAQQQLRRARGLAEKGFVSGEALDTRAAELDITRAEAAQALAQLRAAERNVEKCVVRAPFRAIVRQRLGQVGELAQPGAVLAALADVARVEVVAQVTLAESAQLARAREVRFVGDGGPRRLRLLRVSPAIDPQSRTVEARFAFAAEPAAPGASGRIAWPDPRPHLPAGLLVRRNGRIGVFVDEAGIARFRELPHAQEGRPAAAGLPVLTRVVVRAPQALRDGQSLQASPPPAGALPPGNAQPAAVSTPTRP